MLTAILARLVAPLGRVALPPGKPPDLAARIVRAMTARGYTLDKGEGHVNIVYVEGMEPDGTPNANRPNAYDDLRIVISFKGGEPFIAGKWHATTQPGTRLTQNPVAGARPHGAAIIELGQQRAWTVDLHSGKYEALCQRAAVVTVARDKNMDHRRDGDQRTTGMYGSNQHHGYDSPRNNIGGHSAGCLVTPGIGDHEAFMRLVKSDPRYKANPGRNGFVFATTVMPAAWVLQDYPQPKPDATKMPLFGAIGAAVVAAAAFLADHPALVTIVVLAIFATLAVSAARYSRKD